MTPYNEHKKTDREKEEPPPPLEVAIFPNDKISIPAQKLPHPKQNKYISRKPITTVTITKSISNVSFSVPQNEMFA